MSNPLGRPRGKGPGKYTMSAKAKAARQTVAQLARPGSRRPTPDDKAKAYKADRIGRALTLEVTEQASEYLRLNRLVLKRCAEIVTDREASAEQVAAIFEARIKPGELVRMFDSGHNRWGQPPRSVLEVDAANRIPALFEVPLSGWQGREGAHADAVAGNGHANGHTEH